MPGNQTQNERWSPPEFYQRVDSSIPGVIVYAPQSKPVEEDQTQEFQMPELRCDRCL